MLSNQIRKRHPRDSSTKNDQLDINSLPVSHIPNTSLKNSIIVHDSFQTFGQSIHKGEGRDVIEREKKYQEAENNLTERQADLSTTVVKNSRYTSLPKVRIPNNDMKSASGDSMQNLSTNVSPKCKSKIGYGVWNKELQRVKFSRKKIMSQPFDSINHSLNDGLKETFQTDRIQSLKSVSGTGNLQVQQRVDFSQSMRKSSLNTSIPQYVGELKDGMKDGYGLWLESKDDPNSNQYRGEFMNDKK